MNVELWTVQEWVAAVTIAGTFVAVFVRSERRMGKFLTRDEHDRICEKRNNEIREFLQIIRDDIRELRQEARER